MFNAPKVWQIEDWNDIYIAALVERDPDNVPFLIHEAERAIIDRARELFKASGDIFEEEEALNDALYALRGLKSCPAVHGDSRKQHKREPLMKLTSIFAEKRPHHVSGKARVLIADRSYFARQALRQTFEHEKDFAICGEAVHGCDAMRAALLLRPDLVVLDLVMPVMNGVGAARMLRRLMPALPMIVRYELKDKCIKQATRLVGIAALVSKTEPVGSLVHRARSLLAGTEAASATVSMFAAV
jgi:CheY-like chemotaxis protein